MDFKIVFESIHRCKMLKILNAYGVLERLSTQSDRYTETLKDKYTVPIEI